jgi:uncharacterized membrane protein
MYARKAVETLNLAGLILLFIGIMLSIVGFGDHQHNLESSQHAVGGVLIAIVGIILLWRGSKIKEPKMK